MNTTTIAFVTLASLFAGSAVAAEGDFYVGAGFGQARYELSGSDIDRELVGLGFASSATTVDDNDSAWKVFAGYKIFENFAIEGGWVDLGKAETNTVTTGPASTDLGEVEASGLFVDAVGLLPINKHFTVFGKVGVFRANVDARVTVLSGGSAAVVSASDDSFEGKFGVGASYDFTERFGVRLEYERYNNVGGDNTGEGDIDLWMLGLYARF